MLHYDEKLIVVWNSTTDLLMWFDGLYSRYRVDGRYAIQTDSW